MELQIFTLVLGFCMGSGDLNLSPHASVASILSTVMISVDCQFGRIWNYLGDKPLGISVRDYVDYIN